jgi:hypothetical protein
MTTTDKIMEIFDHAIYAEESYVVAAYRETISKEVQALVDERDRLRKAAQMALKAIDEYRNQGAPTALWADVQEALRKEIEQ